jgi:hypothetical protein
MFISSVSFSGLTLDCIQTNEFKRAAVVASITRDAHRDADSPVVFISQTQPDLETEIDAALEKGKWAVVFLSDAPRPVPLTYDALMTKLVDPSTSAAHKNEPWGWHGRFSYLRL